MRILAIRGQNLASLARAFEVDLTREPLGAAGLFAITGPVGAGKSTLLDALCLPLFDRTPRLSGRGGPAIGDDGQDPGDWLRGNDPRGLLRRDAVEGFAEVDFVGRDGGRYRARWSVRRARRRPDGRLQEQELSLQDLERRGVVANGRRSEVLAAVEQRLGLDFQQFCRSVLLAQGEFAAFLRAAADERARLLENLTGADIYRRLSRAAHDGRRRREQQLAALQAQGQVQPLLDDAARARLEAEVAAREAEVMLHRAAVELAQRYVNWYAAAAAHHERESKATFLLQQAVQDNQAAAGRREALERRRRALPLVPRLEQVAAAQRDLAAAIAAREQAKQSAAAATAAAQRAAEALAEALAATWPGLSAPPPVVAEFERWQAPLQRFCDRDAAAATAAARVESLRVAVEAVAAKEAAAAARASDAEAVVHAAEAVVAAAAEVVAAPGWQVLPARRQRLDAEAAALARVREAVAHWQRAAQAASDAAAAHAELVQQQGLLVATFPAAVKAREVAELELQHEREALERTRTRVGLAQFRDVLRPGEPCPLCGAAEHPAPVEAHAAELDAARAAFERAEQHWRQAHEAVVREQSQRQAVERALAAAATTVATAAHNVAAAAAGFGRELVARQEALGGEEPLAPASPVDATAWLVYAESALLAQRDELSAAERAAGQARQRLDAATAAANGARDSSRSSAAALAALRTERDAAQRQLEAIVGEGQRAAASVAELAATLQPAFPPGHWQAILRQPTGLPTLQRLARLAAAQRAAAAAAAVAATALVGAGEAVQAQQASLAKANELMRLALAAADVTPSDVSEVAAVGMAELQREQAALRELDVAVERAREAVATHARLRQEHEAGGRPAIAEHDAARALADARTAATNVERERDALRSRLGADDLLRRQHQELAPRIAAATQELDVWRALDDLIGSSTGDAFAIFAQGLTLDLLLAEANTRLGELARRYRLERIPGGEMDFVVADLDLGGTRRSLQSLSGGETFLVSLALALALATLAAPRARVETLFLDEGFGTLDAQNLEAALGALDVLQAGGCQVGVISHVDGIAERIGAVVEVRPDGTGQSRVIARTH